MKKNFGIVLAIALGLSALLLTIAFQAGWVQANPFKQETRAGAPAMVSYQGQIWDGDTPYNGTGYFKFAILDFSSTIQYWSNDTLTEPPVAYVTLPVVNGLFSITLGDTSIEGMNHPLTASVFDETYTCIRIWFSPDASNWTQIPDHKIVAVPYALQADQAANSDHATFADSATDATHATSADSATNATNATNAINSDTLDGSHASSFQLRVTGSCPVGYAVKVINTDGSVGCQVIPDASTFTITTLDTGNETGISPSIALGTDGLGLISYRDGLNGSLKIAHCINTNCTGSAISTLDSSADVGYQSSLAIGTDGLGLISHYDYTNGNLKTTHCNDTACNSAVSYTLDADDDVGRYSSLAIGVDNFGLISYYDTSNGDLKVAHCTDTNCSTANINTLDSTGNVGTATAIAIGRDGLGLISYIDYDNYQLKVAHCSNIECSTATTTVIDSAPGIDRHTTSIVIGADSLGLISYSLSSIDSNGLKVAHCSNLDCSSSSTYVLDPDYVGKDSSITIGSDGLGLISYTGAWPLDNLKVAHCIDLACSSAVFYELKPGGEMGMLTSIAIGADGLGLISYFDSGNRHLNVAHCSNLLCFPKDGSMLP